MTGERRFDYIIAGAGASGLLLLDRLLDNGLPGKRILLADRQLNTVDDKTWSFWSRHPLPFRSVEQSWDRLTVISRGCQFNRSGGVYRYYSVRSGEFRRELLSRAAESERVTLLECDIHGFSYDSEGIQAVMYTSVGEFFADWIFQSARKPPQRERARVDNVLLQHFTGREILCDRDCFDPGSVLLMDIDVPQRDGLTFFYLLPFSKRQALIEYTLFSEQRLPEHIYEHEIEHYLANRFQLVPDNYRVIRTERGDIPMEDRRFDNYNNPRTLSIGVAGGLTKPSSGYTFSRMADYAVAVADALKNGQNPPAWQGSPFRFRVYDLLLLRLLRMEPDYGPEVFHRLFEQNRMETVLEFLDEKSSLTTELGILSGMPPAPFFRALGASLGRILKGA